MPYDGEPWLTKVKYPDFKCQKCKQNDKLTCHVWDSSCGGYTDYHYECGDCGHSWWYEGADA